MRIFRTISLALWLLLCPLPLAAADAEVSAGGRVPGPLSLMLDAAGAVADGSGTAALPDATALYRNPAAVPFASRRAAIGYSVALLADDFSWHALTGFYRIDSLQSLVAGIRYGRQKPWTVAGTDDAARDLVPWRASPSDWTVELGYAARVSRHDAVSVTVRYIVSEQAGPLPSAGAIGFDAGWLHRTGSVGPEHRTLLQWGVRLANMGGKLDYGGTPLHQPLRISAGGLVQRTFHVVHALQLSGEAGYRPVPSGGKDSDVVAGVRYIWRETLSAGAGWRHTFQSKTDALSCGLRLSLRAWTLSAERMLAADDPVGCDAWHFSLQAAF
ncbi:MAG: PorV/PorQ family protein [Bacteroidales bacterium]|nr:PorV/PorQ family protein [Bacteroidales bacterium]